MIMFCAPQQCFYPSECPSKSQGVTVVLLCVVPPQQRVVVVSGARTTLVLTRDS